MPTWGPTALAADIDDGRQNADQSAFSSSSTILFVDSSTTASSRYGALFRFTNVTVPQGATIDSAIIRPTITSTANDDILADIQADDVDNSADLSASATIYGRTPTTASVPWSATSLGSGTPVASPDIAAVVQEVIDRPGWVSGNALSILLLGQNSATARTCRIYAREHTAGADEATLQIDYTVAGGSQDLNLPRLAVSPTLRAPEVTPGPIDLGVPRLLVSPTLRTPTLQVGDGRITVPRLAVSPTLRTPIVTHGGQQADWTVGDVEITWATGDVEVTWHVEDPMPARISSLSTQYLRFLVRGRRDGDAVDPTAASLEVALMAEFEDEPAETDWVSGSWETDTGRYYGRARVGPLGDIPLPTADNVVRWLWCRFSHNAETIVERVGAVYVD